MSKPLLQKLLTTLTTHPVRHRGMPLREALAKLFSVSELEAESICASFGLSPKSIVPSRLQLDSRGRDKARILERHRRKYRERRAAGICVQCGVHPSGDGCRCVRCKKQKYYGAYRA